MISVTHNLVALNAQRQFNITSRDRAKSSEKLTSGYRINRAADDAACLAISEKMRRQIRGLTQGAENIQDGISLCQVADGAMDEIHDMLNRIEELLVKAANGTNSDDERGYISDEIEQIKDEIDRIGKNTEFNGIKVLQGYNNIETRIETVTRTEHVKEVVGMTLGNTISYETDADIVKYFNMSGKKYHIGDFRYTGTYGAVSTTNFLLDMTSITSSDDWAKLHGTVLNMTCSLGCGSEMTWIFDNTKTGITSDSFPGRENQEYSKVTFTIGTKYYENAQDFMYDLIHNPGDGTEFTGAHDFTITPAKRYVSSANDNQLLFIGSQNFSHVPDSDQGMIRAGRLDINYEYNEYDKEITEDIERKIVSRKKLWIQSGCEADHGIDIEIPYIDKDALDMDRIKLNSSEEAGQSLEYLKDMQNYVSTERSVVGAYQNRLEHSVKINNNVVENTQYAESQIRDTDMADEMVHFSTLDILTQAGFSMMSQANQSNSSVLALLG